MDSNIFKKSSNSLVGSISIERKENKIEFEVLWKDELVANVVVDFVNQSTEVRQYTDDVFMKPFVKNSSSVTVSDVLDFLEDRCFPRERANRDEILKELGLNYYRPLEIVKKTHGVQFDDFMWVRFKGETLSYGDVKVRD